MNNTRKHLLKDHAYTLLKTRIMDGDFNPGTFLSERQLAAQLGMSKTPIRAALERLDVEGFVSVSPQQGVIVREMSVQEVNDLYDLRIALETFVMRRVAGRLNEGQVRQLQDFIDEQYQQVPGKTVAEYRGLDADFHLTLCAFANNNEILRVMKHQRERLTHIITNVLKRVPERMTVGINEHVTILQVLVDGDGEMAARLMQTHLENGKRILLG
ncbi:MAG: GntR family transcriptional regulator [Chloroflexota bacterium]|nr:GntR family transcriptional regulator [Chloroflexota bacterium]